MGPYSGWWWWWGGVGGVGSVSQSSLDPGMHGDYAFVCVEFICLSV